MIKGVNNKIKSVNNIVFSFKNYMILPKKITDTLNIPSPIKEYSLNVVKMSISLKKSTYAAMSPLSERKSLWRVKTVKNP